MLLKLVRNVGTLVEYLAEWWRVFDNVSSYRSDMNIGFVGDVPGKCFVLIAVASVENLTGL